MLDKTDISIDIYIDIPCKRFCKLSRLESQIIIDFMQLYSNPHLKTDTPFNGRHCKVEKVAVV